MPSKQWLLGGGHLDGAELKETEEGREGAGDGVDEEAMRRRRGGIRIQTQTQTALLLGSKFGGTFL